jgi:hypothetical protein
MSAHRFAIGQRVEITSGRNDGAAPAGLYTVTRLLPNDGQDREYRVKNAHDGHERVVRESQVRHAAEGSARETEQRRVFARMTGIPKR